MPSEAPKIDDRSFETIFEDVRLRIPRYLPEWTDFNHSDPGIVLVELFALIADTLNHRLNQAPDRLYAELLSLLDVQLHPARPAEAHLTFEPDPNAVSLGSVPQYTRVAAQPEGGGDPVVFETENGLSLTGTPLAAVQVFDGVSFNDVTPNQQDPALAFRPFGLAPQPGAALYLGFKPKDQGGQAFPDRIRWRLFLPEQAVRAVAQGGLVRRPPPVAPVRVVWEYRDHPERWRPLDLFEDDTAGFLQEGDIAIAGPADGVATKEGKLVDGERHWLRCRIVQGSYPEGRAPEIEALVPNTVLAKQLTTVLEEQIGDGGDGRPDQQLKLRHRPVVRESLEVVDSRGEAWHGIDTIFQAVPDEPAYVLDAFAGELTFGNGTHGRIPQAGLQLYATSYRYGGGGAGNVRPGAINLQLSQTTGVGEVANRRRAVGGKDPQSAEDLARQAPTLIRTRGRAVTAEDFRVLAESFGQVARAAAIPLMHPDFVDLDIPGAVTVVILPEGDERRPEPSADLIRTVLGHLDGHRTLTTELYVAGPRFLEIQTVATIEVRPEASFTAVRNAVNVKLDQYLDPRRWAFGQDFYPSQLYGQIQSVPEVVAVPALEVRVDGAPWDHLERPVRLLRHGLVVPGEHDVTVKPAVDL